jgi:lipopolysaccharide export system protein LptA
MVVRSRVLTYRRGAGEAVYEGDVELKDPQGSARCGKLVVRFDANGRATTAELDGGITLQEGASGRQLSGQRGSLDVTEDFFQMWGSPVLVREPDGNQIKGDRLEWRRRTGTVVVTGGEDSPSETLYHPSQPGVTPTPARRQP